MAMTLFRALVSLAGLTHREAAAYLGVSVDAVKSWSCGRNACRPEILHEMIALVLRQERAAITLRVDPLHPPQTDEAAQAFGWPCLGAWWAAAARALAYGLEGRNAQI